MGGRVCSSHPGPSGALSKPRHAWLVHLGRPALSAHWLVTALPQVRRHEVDDLDLDGQRRWAVVRDGVKSAEFLALLLDPHQSLNRGGQHGAGLGVAVADFDRDGLSDIFVSGSNRLFMSDGPGSFVEAGSSVFEWELYGDEDDVAGATVADVNRDGLLDLSRHRRQGGLREIAARQ